MAEQIAKWPTPSHTSRGSKYEQWLDGSIWKLVPGKDFTTSVPVFRATLGKLGRVRRCVVRTRMIENVLYVQALKEADDA
jgi:hypothetical protein